MRSEKEMRFTRIHLVISIHLKIAFLVQISCLGQSLFLDRPKGAGHDRVRQISTAAVQPVSEGGHECP